ncbi:5-hydroxytryptamine (serotonin) receptor 1A b isoform X1 [Lates japonicus]|uniref:5-hydroxytryptamine (Serotonin) receptor 1A b isoform X1 n=1 Tax=Lates japonicus TaxID=270547 RepID=A0AAD3R5M2_LATJO|nr:5-hydroxytryptamine (serotonin) receptor 1A b isoform X1 [Lates japonicus]
MGVGAGALWRPLPGVEPVDSQGRFRTTSSISLDVLCCTSSITAPVRHRSGRILGHNRAIDYMKKGTPRRPRSSSVSPGWSRFSISVPLDADQPIPAQQPGRRTELNPKQCKIRAKTPDPQRRRAGQKLEKERGAAAAAERQRRSETREDGESLKSSKFTATPRNNLPLQHELRAAVRAGTRRAVKGAAQMDAGEVVAIATYGGCKLRGPRGNYLIKGLLATQEYRVFHSRHHSAKRSDG